MAHTQLLSVSPGLLHMMERSSTPACRHVHGMNASGQPSVVNCTGALQADDDAVPLRQHALCKGHDVVHLARRQLRKDTATASALIGLLAAWHCITARP